MWLGSGNILDRRASIESTLKALVIINFIFVKDEKSYTKNNDEAGEMLRVHEALAEDQGLIPNIYKVAPTRL